MANIFESINRKRSNVYCSNTLCIYNYENVCINEIRIEEGKNLAYASYSDCGLSICKDLNDIYGC